MMQEAIEAITFFQAEMKKNFKERISRKSGWGKNELMAEYEKAESETVWALLRSGQKK